MTMQVGRRSGETASTMSLSTTNEDESLADDLLRFVDAASRHIIRALDRPRDHCTRRRVNHRNYFARIISAGAGPEERRNQTPSTSRPDRRSERRRSSQSVRRYYKARTMLSVIGGRSKSKSVAVISRQNSDHINANGSGKLDNYAAIGEYEGLQMTPGRRPAVSLSSSVYLNGGVLSQASWIENRVPSTVSDETHPSTCFFCYPAACLPHQQSQQLSLERGATTNSRQPYCPCLPCAGLWSYVRREDCSSFVGQQSLKRRVPSSGVYQQVSPPSANDVNTSFNFLSGSSWRYDHNHNELFSSSYWTTSSVTSPFAYSSCDYVSNRDATSLAVGLQNQPSTASDHGGLFPCNNIPSVAVNFFPTSVADGHPSLDYWASVRGANDVINSSPSSFNDSGLGSARFWSSAGTDVDVSGSSDSSSFYWPSCYASSPRIGLQPAETMMDSVCA